MAYALGLDMKMRYNLDGLGITYLAFAGFWTLLLIPGCVFLLKNRQLPNLRIRNIPLSVGAVATLHVYFILTLTAYVFNGYFPCTTEFWIMSIYLPLGIALFQASNTQLLHISDLQKKFAGQDTLELKATGLNSVKGRVRVFAQVNRFQSMNSTDRALLMIGIGMVLQVIFTLIIFMVSRAFHPGFGAVGRAVDMAACRKGWEWWPSIAWQFFWAWVYAPYLLWKVRNIDDVHGWRTQTIFCCIAGLPASPMWLCALYVPQMAIVSKYFVPPVWFSVSIVLMQGFTVFAPCYQTLKNHRLTNETQNIIAEWEKKHKYGTLSSGSATTARNSKFSFGSSKAVSVNSRRGEMYTLGALEKTLNVNPTPLLLFSALKDFSGENISFLNHVREWKAKWQTPSRPKFSTGPEPAPVDAQILRRQQFRSAVEIYSAFVSLKYSNFPLNLSSQHLKELEALFDTAAAMINSANDNAATPFDAWSAASPEDVEALAGGKDGHSMTTITAGDDTTGLLPEVKHLRQIQMVKVSGLADNLPADVPIPEFFNSGAFDNAETHVKGLVLTNTWPKFVNAGYAQQKKTLLEQLSHLQGNVNQTFARFRFR